MTQPEERRPDPRPEPRPDPIPPPREPSPPRPAADPSPAADASLLALIDRLTAILDRSELQELEVEAGGTALRLRKRAEMGPPRFDPRSAGAGAPGAAAGEAPVPVTAAAATPAHSTVTAPLTGLFYTSPAPGSAPYIRVGGEVAVGQVIGLIEAMKLFNEIKSTVAGRVTRIAAESGALVKAKQVLIEVEPL
jgi:acetyl-CoA carboxylase biotin carboxyl carrier protein